MALAVSGDDAIHIGMGMHMAPHTPETPLLPLALGVNLRHDLAAIAQRFSQFSQPGELDDAMASLVSSFPLSTIAST